MAKFGVQMLNGKSYEVDAQHGDEAKSKVYAIVDRESPSTPHGDPARRVKAVENLDK